jgi:hypothetical protein
MLRVARSVAAVAGQPYHGAHSTPARVRRRGMIAGASCASRHGTREGSFRSSGGTGA